MKKEKTTKSQKSTSRNKSPYDMGFAEAMKKATRKPKKKKK